jgi:hypothetical protein
MIIVTPYIVKPAKPGEIAQPTDGFADASDPQALAARAGQPALRHSRQSGGHQGLQGAGRLHPGLRPRQPNRESSASNVSHDPLRARRPKIGLPNSCLGVKSYSSVLAASARRLRLSGRSLSCRAGPVELSRPQGEGRRPLRTVAKGPCNWQRRSRGLEQQALLEFRLRLPIRVRRAGRRSARSRGAARETPADTRMRTRAIESLRNGQDPGTNWKLVNSDISTVGSTGGSTGGAN